MLRKLGILLCLVIGHCWKLLFVMPALSMRARNYQIFCYMRIFLQ